MVFLHVTILQTHVDNAGKTVTKAGRESALVKHHIVHHIGILGRGEALQVLRIVECETIHQEEVLVIVATTHVDARLAIAC